MGYSYMGYEYDPLQPMNYLQYLDANNLYDLAMSQSFPTGEFRWIDIENLVDETEKVINRLSSNSKFGYQLFVRS